MHGVYITDYMETDRTSQKRVYMWGGGAHCQRVRLALVKKNVFGIRRALQKLQVPAPPRPRFAIIILLRYVLRVHKYMCTVGRPQSIAHTHAHTNLAVPHKYP